MIGYLRGKVIYSSLDYVIIETGGVGYEVRCSGAAYSRLVGGKEGEVYTYLQVNENGINLFGFESIKEKELFLKLTTVSGVAAKSALAILTQLSGDRVMEAIATADVKTLSSVKGLGKKTAEKIILELHGKISASDLIGEEGIAVSSVQKMSKADEEAVEALGGLGFTRNESLGAVERAKASGAVSVEDIIRAALSGM